MNGLPYLSEEEMVEVEKLCAYHSLRVPAIDEQHRVLFMWYVAIRNTQDPSAVLRGLVTYAVQHFEFEEQWAKQHGVNIAKHCGLHADLCHKLNTLATRVPAREPLMSLLYEWLTVHIGCDDRQLLQSIPKANP